MASDDTPLKTEHTTQELPSDYVPPRPPPKKRLPLKLIFICTAVAAVLVLASNLIEGPKTLHPLGRAGPTYTSGDVTWQSFDPTWTTLQGEHALDMNVNFLRVRGSEEPQHTLDGEFLRAVCGSVLTRLPNPPEGVTRTDIYRLGFRFVDAEDKKLTDIFPVAVQDGACLSHDEQVMFTWAFPGSLKGWSPVNYDKEKDGKVTMTFGRRGETRVPYDQVDLRLACRLLFQDASDQMRQILDGAKHLTVRIVKGFTNSVAWIGLHREQSFQIVNDDCFPEGNVLDG